MIRLWLTLGTAGILAASPARAQDLTPPRLEIGGTVSGLVPIVYENGPAVLASAGPRVTVNVTPRFGVELSGEVLGPVEFSGTMALYQTQVKLPFRTSRDGQRTLSFTVGAVGIATYRRTRETRIARLDGSTVVYPGSGGSRPPRPPRSASAWRGKRCSAAPSRTPWPCRRTSVQSEASP